jgi:glycogen synthase
VKDNANGFLIRRKSAPAIAEQVNKLLKDDTLRKKMSETAYKTVVERFSWDRIGDKFYNTYQKAIESRKTVKHAPDSLILSAFKRFLEMRNDVVDTFPVET